MKIDYEKCDECGSCICVCKSGAITFGEHLAISDTMCTSCGLCAKICPAGALICTSNLTGAAS